MKKFILAIVKSIIFIWVYLELQGVFSNLLIGLYASFNRPQILKMSSAQLETIILNNIGLSLGITIVFMFFLLMFLYRFSKRGLLERCRFRKFKLEYLLYIVMIVGGFAFINSILVSILSRYITSYQQTNTFISNMESTMITMFIVNLLGPIFEEILFRGVIFDELQGSSPVYIAVIIQAIMFGVAHGNLLQGIYTFTLGIMLAIINYYCKSLWSDIIGHILFNCLGGFLIPIIFGISTFLYLGLVFLGIIFLVLGLYLLIIRSKSDGSSGRKFIEF